jgi:hypothetical protein
MGSMIYEIAPALAIRDRELRHLQAVIIGRLRRHEACCFAWDDEPDIGGDDSKKAAGPGLHGAVWISPSSSLYFSYESPMTEPLRRDWLEVLGNAAASGTLRTLPEPAPMP